MRKWMILPNIVILLIFLSFCLCLMTRIWTAYAEADFREVEQILGATGQMQDGVFVVRFPRSDLKVNIDGEPMPTALGFGSWTAWKSMGNTSMVMGDLVLLEKEINPVISALAEADIKVTALHNHFLGEQPRIMYMHIHGMGENTKLAKGIRTALNLTATPAVTAPKASPAGTTPSIAINTKRLEEIIGYKGQVGGEVFKFTVGRSGVRYHGVELTASMGMNSWAAFVGTEDRAYMAGDVAMLADEVNSVIRVLRKHGVNIVSVHNHMLDEEPRIFFLHYWGSGRSEDLARAFREALDQLKGM